MKLSQTVIDLFLHYYATFPQLADSIFSIQDELLQGAEGEFGVKAVRYLCFSLTHYSTDEGEQFWQAMYDFVANYQRDLVFDRNDLVNLALTGMEYHAVKELLEISL